MGETERPRQLPLDFAPMTGQTRDDLVVGHSNEAAVRLVDTWPRWPSAVVVLAGPPGAGKTHLASVWADRAAAHRVEPARLANAVGTDGPVLVDDADRGGMDEKALFHLINDVMGRRSHLLLTARRFPSAWGVTLPDLVSRLKLATTVEIAEPDDALLAGVIAKLFADRQVDVEPHVIQYLVRRIERSLATAIGVVERLDRTALEQQSRITRALAAEVITAMDEGQATLGF